MTGSEAKTEDASRSIPSVKQYKDLVLHVLAKMSYDYNQDPAPEDLELRKAMENALDVGSRSTTLRQAILEPFEAGYAVANIAYHHSPWETKLFIAIYTTLAIYIDNEASPDRLNMLKGFAQKLLKHEPHENPYHDHLARLITNDAGKLFGPFATSCIITSCLDYIVGCGLELEYPNGFPAMSESLPGWVRRKTGNSDAYSFFLFPEAVYPEDRLLGHFLAAIPDVVEWINNMNDILSYYKERIVGSEGNCYIANGARILGETELEVLRKTAEHTEVVQDRITAVLSRKEELLKPWKHFANGYIKYHMHAKRYKLKDIF
ncbi:hypothetical protein E4U41_002417 [Claviceps citrina]|nr:hypothetical protein E4U41_002417 [Claviceps citrina]